ncbi:hypothetical protein COB55_05210 [Candidatus Wolfebacteria bacterium]|nr:MAG: hypothetical protein COB55_05210 [Candidatus Wolfebacteria bacterium]
MKNYICNNTEYFFGNGYIAVPVLIESLPKTLEVNGKILFLKSSFHVSLVCVKDIVSQYGTAAEQRVIDLLCNFVSENKISFTNYKDEVRYAVDEETGRETLIVMSDVSNIDEFFKRLNKELGFNIEVPPTHITLYTLQPDKGIGLNTSSDIEEKSTILTEEIPEEIKNLFV